MKKVYKFTWDCGRQGCVNGTFVADEADMDAAMGKQIYFGEILGKHSEIYGELDCGDIEVLSDIPEEVAVFEKLGGCFGYNPLQYIQEGQE